MNAFDRIVASLTQPAPPRAKKLSGAVAVRTRRSREAIGQAVRLLRRHGYRVEPPERR